MLKLPKTRQLSLLLIPVATLLASSQNAAAQIYKWQDERGVVQYSDKKPNVKSTIATQAEVVNSLQAKDLCTIPQVATKSKAAKIAINDLFNSEFLSANFFAVAPIVSNKAANTAATSIASNTVTASNTVKVATSQPVTAAATSPSTSNSVNTNGSVLSVPTMSLNAAIATSTPTTTSWVKCANQFQSCQFQGLTKKVRYGNSGKYFYGTFKNYVGCSDSAFKGDPLPKAAKVCEIETITASTSGSTTATTPTTTTPTTTTDWTKCANEFQTCQFQGKTKSVRFGLNGKFVYANFTNYVGCSVGSFKSDPTGQAGKICEMKDTVVAQSGTTTTGTTTTPSKPATTTGGSTTTTGGSTTTGSTTGSTAGSGSTTGSGIIDGITNIIQKDLMPAVNIALNMTSAVGTRSASNKLLIFPTTEQPTPYEFSDGGAVRVDCSSSHMGNNDPIVFPNQAGAAHHHTFFGNTSVNEKTTHASLVDPNTTSTCSGGSMNKSAYWVPSMINTKTNTPIVPVNNVAYYKTGNSAEVTVPPEGLRMIAGNQKATTPFSGNQASWRFTCNQDYTTHADHIPVCSNGSTMEYMIIFPECWNGKDLDSPNHQDHMAYPTAGGSCPATHPVRIPQIAFNIHYNVNDANGTKYWRLASDNYSTDKPGGYSAHGDWMEGWDRTMIKRLVNNCLKAHKDCHAHLTGDGFMFDRPEFH